MQGVLILKGFQLENIKGNFCARKCKKISTTIKNVNESEDNLMHKGEGPSNYFFQLFHTLSS